MNLIIKNGVIATHKDTFRADILCCDGKIAEISDNITADGDVIDAGGKYVLPGGVDVHTHLNLKLGDRQVSDGFYHGTLAAAHGGTTTIIDHPEAGPDGCSLRHQPELYKRMLRDEAVIDYGIHGVFQSAEQEILDEIAPLADEGISSMKVYTTYANMLEGDDIRSVIDAMAKVNCLTAFHAEDDSIIKTLREEHKLAGTLSPAYHALSRPDTAEAEAIKMLSVAAGANEIYIVHLSSRLGLDTIKNLRKDGKKILAETCPQYLLLTEDRYNDPDGLKYVMAPPLRKEADTKALWQGLIDGSIQVVATDHCSFSYADKLRYGKADYQNCPGGAPGVETRMPIMFSEGVVKKRFDINKFVELTSYSPARIMGLGGQKGEISIGADADILVWDAEITKTISADTLHQRCDYTPYEGMEVTGWPVMTILRGDVIVHSGEFIGRKGAGKFLLRKNR